MTKQSSSYLHSLASKNRYAKSLLGGQKLGLGLGVVAVHLLVAYGVMTVKVPMVVLPSPTPLSVTWVQALPDEPKPNEPEPAVLPTPTPRPTLDQAKPINQPAKQTASTLPKEPLKKEPAKQAKLKDNVAKEPAVKDGFKKDDLIKDNLLKDRLKENTAKDRPPIAPTPALPDNPQADNSPIHLPNQPASQQKTDNPKPVADTNTADNLPSIDNHTPNDTAKVASLPKPASPNVAPKATPKKDTPKQSNDEQTAAMSQHWQNQVRLAIEKNLQYPEQALAKKWGGKSAVKITVDKAGNVLAVAVVQSSGKSILDNEALAVVKRSSPLPNPPDDVLQGNHQQTFVIPIYFNYKKYQ